MDVHAKASQDAIAEQQLDQHVTTLCRSSDAPNVPGHAKGVAHLKTNHGHVTPDAKTIFAVINSHVKLDMTPAALRVRAPIMTRA